MKTFILSLCVLGLTGNVTLAADANKNPHKAKMPTLTTEQRKKMADAHEKMAACLRSDKPLEECHKDMMKACHENMGKEGCPMMGEKGKHHHHMDMDEDKGDSENKK